MSRARNIKPGFFRNADLVELPVETRLLFIGLWGLADREGRLDDRPKQIKMEIYPADTFDIDAMLEQLSAAGFIDRYQVNENKYIQIVNFTKHQNPHRDEKASTIPAPCKHDANTVAIVLNPESLLLNPESLIPEPNHAPDEPAKRARADYPELFDEAWDHYPPRQGANKRNAFKAWSARVKAGVDPSVILQGVKRYADYCKASGTEPRYIKQPNTFFGPDEHYLSDWTPPARASPRGESEKDRSRRETYEAMTGKKHEPANERIIDAFAERVD